VRKKTISNFDRIDMAASDLHIPIAFSRKVSNDQLLQYAILCLSTPNDGKPSRIAPIREMTEAMIQAGQGLFVGQVARYARYGIHNREMGLQLTAEIGLHWNLLRSGDLPLTEFFSDMIGEPSDMVAIVHVMMRDRPKKHLPAPIRRGFRAAFDRFTDQELRSVFPKAGAAGWTIREIAQYCGPTPNEGNAETLNVWLAGQDVPIENYYLRAMTAETREEERFLWTKALELRQIDQIDLLTLLPGIAVRIQPDLDPLVSLVTDPTRIRAASVFDYLSAELSCPLEEGELLAALADGADESLRRESPLPGNVLVAIDRYVAEDAPLSEDKDEIWMYACNLVASLAVLNRATVMTYDHESAETIFHVVGGPKGEVQIMPANGGDVVPYNLVSFVDVLAATIESADLPGSPSLVFNEAQTAPPFDQIIFVTGRKIFEGDEGEILQHAFRGYCAARTRPQRVFNISVVDESHASLHGQGIVSLANVTPSIFELLWLLACKSQTSFIQLIQSYRVTNGRTTK
jgi:hypothetical protein